MSTHAVERERFLVAMEAEGMDRAISRRILRHANTIQRLSAAECNGDYPCDNGERKVIPCSRCEAGYVRSSMVRDRGRQVPGLAGIHPRICPNCRAQDRIAQWCAKAGCCPNGEGVQDRVHQHARFLPVFQGDPRGACVKLKVPSGRTDDGNHEGVCVPTRRY